MNINLSLRTTPGNNINVMMGPSIMQGRGPANKSFAASQQGGGCSPPYGRIDDSICFQRLGLALFVLRKKQLQLEVLAFDLTVYLILE